MGRCSVKKDKKYMMRGKKGERMSGGKGRRDVLLGTRRDEKEDATKKMQEKGRQKTEDEKRR